MSLNEYGAISPDGWNQFIFSFIYVGCFYVLWHQNGRPDIATMLVQTSCGPEICSQKTLIIGLTRYLLDRHKKSKYKKVSIFRPLQLCHWTFLAEVNTLRYIGQKPVFSFFGSSFWACSKKHAIFFSFFFLLIWKLHHLCKHTCWYYGCPGLLQRFLNGPLP